MYCKIINKPLVAAFICLSVAACGGDEAPNTAPTISLSNVTIKERAVVNVPATITDSDGSVSKISWTQKNGPSVTLTDANHATLTFKAPSVEKDETLVFAISVTDDGGAVATQDVSVIVLNNQLPILTASNATVQERKNIQLKAAAQDADGTIASWAWKQKSGVAALVASNSDTLNFTAPEVAKDETFLFEVQATDDSGESVTKEIEVQVLNNRTPLVEVNNVTAKERAPIRLEMKASDLDGSVVNYGWTQKSGTSATLSNTTSPTLTFNAPVVDADEVLVFSAKAVDDAGEFLIINNH